jgi:hypothetical protein
LSGFRNGFAIAWIRSKPDARFAHGAMCFQVKCHREAGHRRGGGSNSKA